MTQRVDRNSRNHKRWSPTISTIRDRIESRIASENAPEHSRPAKLIPWEDIWTSLRIARMRGNGEMIEVFYDVLFKEAVFDDRGAWSWDLKKSFLRILRRRLIVENSWRRGRDSNPVTLTGKLDFEFCDTNDHSPLGPYIPINFEVRAA